MKKMIIAMMLLYGCASIETAEQKPKNVKTIPPGNAVVIPPQVCPYDIEGYDDDGNGTVDRVILRMDMECKRKMESPQNPSERRL